MHQVEGQIGCQPVHGHHGCCDEVRSSFDRYDGLSSDPDELCLGPALGPACIYNAHDRLSDQEPIDVRADLADSAREFHAWHVRRDQAHHPLGLATGTHKQIGRVHGGRSNLNEQVPRPGLGDGELYQLEDVRSAVAVEAHGLHQ